MVGDNLYIIPLITKCFCDLLVLLASDNLTKACTTPYLCVFYRGS